MAGWRDIPNELTSQILCTLASEYTGRTHELAKLMRVCHRFHAVLESIVYASPQISVRRRRPGVFRYDEELQGDYVLLRYFARSIVSRPSLGLLVKDLSVRSGRGIMLREDVQIKNCNAVVDDESLIPALESFSVPARDDVRLLASAAAQKGLPNGLILEGRFPGLLIFLLHYLPSLTSLSVVCSDEISVVTSAALGRVQGGVPIGLRSIKCLDLQYNDEVHRKYGLSAETVIPFMTLPALTKLSCYRLSGEYGWELFSSALNEGSDEWSEIREKDNSDSDAQDAPGDFESGHIPVPLHETHYLRPRSSAIMLLKFEESCSDNDILGRILALPRRLESFQYSIGDRMVGDAVFEASAIYEGLRTQKASLVEIFITRELWDHCTYSPWHVLGSLNDFSRLRHLKMPVTALLTCESEHHPITPPRHNPLDSLLPPSLVILEVDIRDTTLEELTGATGLPDTLHATSLSLPNLRIFGIVDILRKVRWGHDSLESRCIWPNSWSASHNIQLVAIRAKEVFNLVCQTPNSCGFNRERQD